MQAVGVLAVADWVAVERGGVAFRRPGLVSVDKLEERRREDAGRGFTQDVRACLGWVFVCAVELLHKGARRGEVLCATERRQSQRC